MDTNSHSPVKLLILVLLCLNLTGALSGLRVYSASTSTPTLMVKKGSEADLKCSYSGVFEPTLRVEWKFRDINGSVFFIFFAGEIVYKNKDRFTQYEGGLRITNVTMEDTGDYMCEVSANSAYADVTMKLTVIEHAFSASTTTPTVMVKEHSGADMTCSYSPDFGSTPRVEWKFKDINGSKFFIFFDGQITFQYKDRFTQYEGGLRIEKTTRKDTGDYTCEVSGNGRYADVTIKLTVIAEGIEIQKPDAPSPDAQSGIVAASSMGPQ